ncbi:hypothetical protein KC963_03420 [Candidatus Saccharibacteria bacterium]|nr:hypothetical protein [Candidatus Saccharibacteria bacterium]
MSLSFEIVKPDEEAIFMALDNALFWGEITQSHLGIYVGIDEELTEIDGLVGKAVARACNISLPARGECYNSAKGRQS